MNFDDRFGASFPNRLPFGVSLAGLPPQSPMQGPVPMPLPRPPGAPPIATDVYSSPGGPATDPNAAPFRLDRGLPPRDPYTPSAMPAPAPLTATSFPEAGGPGVPYTRPAVNAGPQGVTLASAPAPGFAGTVGAEAPPADVKPAMPKADPDKVFAGLEEINKGIQNKVSPQEAAAAAQIIPMTAQPNSGGQLSSDLMSQLLRGKQSMRGLTLTGRPL